MTTGGLPHSINGNVQWEEYGKIMFKPPFLLVPCDVDAPSIPVVRSSGRAQH